MDAHVTVRSGLAPDALRPACALSPSRHLRYAFRRFTLECFKQTQKHRGQARVQHARCPHLPVPHRTPWSLVPGYSSPLWVCWDVFTLSPRLGLSGDFQPLTPTCSHSELRLYFCLCAGYTLGRELLT